MPQIPRYVWVTISAWVSRILMAFISLATIRILLRGLGTEQYSVFAVMSGITAWFTLLDFGTGISAQNYISERRANDRPYSDFIAAGALLSIILLVVAVGLLLLAAGPLATMLLQRYSFLPNAEKGKLFFAVGFFSTVVVLAGFVNRVWYARQMGFLANLTPVFGAAIGLALIKVVAASALTNKLLWSAIAFFAPTALITAIAMCTLLPGVRHHSFATLVQDTKLLLRRGSGHWLFALFANATLNVDYIVISQLLGSNDIVTYNITSKVFAIVFFIYSAVLISLWPNCSEAVARGRWDLIRKYLGLYIGLGIALVIVATLAIALFREQILQILAPGGHVSLSLSLILLFGLYFVVRVWTDMFAMVLQSFSALKTFLIAVPIQALIGVVLQIVFAKRFGMQGIPIALTISFLCTVSWVLPLTLHYKRAASLT